MRIICLTTDISTVGGIERAMSTMCNYFVENHNYDVEIISLYKLFKKKPAFHLNNKIKLSYCNFEVSVPKSFVEKITQNFRQIYHIKKALKDKEYDVLITFHPHISIPVLINKGNSRRKIIVTEHSDYNNITALWNFMRKITYKRADKVVVLTESNKRKYERFTSKNLCVIPNAIPFCTDNHSELNNNRIISVGRLEKEKGFDRLIEIYKKVYEKYDYWKVDIVGEGSEKETLNKLIEENGLQDNMKILDFTDNIQLEYLKSDICVIPSRSEAFSMVAVEAMQCGVPVISFDLPGPSSIINGRNGIIVKNNDLDEFAKEVIRLIRDKNLMIQYAKNAKEYSGKYTIKNIGEIWVKMIKEVV